ncbi:MAG: type II toxin-antitoxin system death-on-curing family toxin [Anaerolineae bacterium]
MSKIIYLTADDLYNINAQVTQALPYVRDRHLLLSAVNRPKLSFYGQSQFPTLHDKAAALLESLAYHHLFADGNKRTALLAVTRFLEVNGWQPTWSAQAEYDYILQVAQGKQTLEQIAAWLRAHSVEAR